MVNDQSGIFDLTYCTRYDLQQVEYTFFISYLILHSNDVFSDVNILFVKHVSSNVSRRMSFSADILKFYLLFRE